MQPHRIPIHTNKAFALILLLLAVLLALPALAVNNTVDETLAFALDGVTEIHMNLSSVPLRLIAAPEGTQARFHLHGDAPAKIWLEGGLHGGVLTVSETREAAIVFGQEHMALDVYLPANYAQSLTVDTASGGITADALALERLTLRSSSGGIELAPLSARTVMIANTSGCVNAEAVTAETLTIEVSSGNVAVRALSARDCAVTATSGDVALRYAAFGGDALYVSSSSGRVALALPADASFGFDISRSSSLIRSDFAEIAAFGQEPDTLRGRVNGGTGSLSIACTSGDIDILKQ